MKTIEANLKDVLLGTKGKFVTVEWIKKDGTLRKATVQTNVKKGITGVGRLWEDKDNQLTMYEKATQRRVVVTTDRIVSVECGDIHMRAEQ